LADKAATEAAQLQEELAKLGKTSEESTAAYAKATEAWEKAESATLPVAGELDTAKTKYADAKKKAGIDLAFFGPDNKGGATLAGDALAKDLGPGAKVVILEGNPEADNAKERKEGFMDSVKSGKLELLDSKTAHWETEEANTVMTNFLTKYKDIQGVMAANDSMALGVVKALDAAGQSGKIKVVGFDNIPPVQPLIKDGKMLATVEQYGAQMAGLGIQYGMRELAGEKFTGWVKTDIKLVTAADLK
jgi:ribose transport system substrate-binding protein